MKRLIAAIIVIFSIACSQTKQEKNLDLLRTGFLNPPDSSKPGVYWYFMDGNMSKSAITEDLMAMKKAGIAYVIFLEVNMGVPRGKVDFLSEEWQDRFAFLVHEAKRFGITVTLGIGPGWTGSGGPWVTGEQSMQHLVAGTTTIAGGTFVEIALPIPPPVKPFFGESGLGDELHKRWSEFSKDVAVLAFPAASKFARIDNILEKGLFYRPPFSSQKNVPAFLSTDTLMDQNGSVIMRNQIIDLTDSMDKDGNLHWHAPLGKWDIMRFVARNNGAVTRPAPIPGLGFESDKLDTTALNAHLDHYIGTLLRKIGPDSPDSIGGLKMLHIDSWEMGAQNWTSKFRQEFIKRRGYDPLPFYPVYQGLVVESKELSERFLWDLRQTAQELVIQNHALHVKDYAHRAGLGLSIEPYDMNPTADLELGRVADIPMCEFWSRNMGFNTAFSTIEATSIAHVEGRPVVASEAFTSCDKLAWMQFPGAMKNQTDWAFASGINRFYFHTFQHQPLNSQLKPGMTMGECGIHWNRNQTFWPMVDEYHKYVSRCQYLLQQGVSNADILFITPEGAPQIFVPPHSALTGDSLMPDRKPYNFDGCSPSQLMTAKVKDKKIVFPSGATYSVAILPRTNSISVSLLKKIKTLLADGAIIARPEYTGSNGLNGFPGSDSLVRKISAEIDKGKQVDLPRRYYDYPKADSNWDKLLMHNASDAYSNELYPDYRDIVQTLLRVGIMPDFVADPRVRYTHRTIANAEVYFVSNKTDTRFETKADFRAKGNPELWDPLTGTTEKLSITDVDSAQTQLSLSFRPHESYFVVFTKQQSSIPDHPFEKDSITLQLEGPWTVAFDIAFGGPSAKHFDSLTDWRNSSDSGIRFYSGIAKYSKSFDYPSKSAGRVFLDLGTVKNIARVSLNNKPVGVVWTNPWRVEITNLLHENGNKLEIEVANLWINRMVGDDGYPEDGVQNGEWPKWLIEHKPRPTKRISFVTNEVYHRTDTLLPSGLLGPVRIVSGFTRSKVPRRGAEMRKDAE